MTTFKFLAQAVVAGLAAAFVLLLLFPQLGGETAPQPASPPPARPSASPAVASYHGAVSAVAPAVVNIYATRVREPRSNPLLRDPLFQRFFGEISPAEQVERDFGTGVILDTDGYVITSLHIIRDADEILVTLPDGRQTTAEIVGLDAATELALLKLGNADNLPAAPIGDSDALEVGDIVLAIGNPYDFGQTVTQGIVSATGRKSLGIATFADFIQTDADINPGNSGGALINAAGELVGINTANYSDTGGSQGIGFAIPVNLAIDVMRQLIEHGHVVRGWLGIEARLVPRDVAENTGLQPGGVMVTALLRDGPAARAGIMPGDILAKINGEPLFEPRQAIEMIARFEPGTAIDITVIRGWEEMQIQARVGQRPALLP